MEKDRNNRQSIYAEVTARVIAELEEGRLPWVKPWDDAACACDLPANAVSGRRYSGINILILWHAVMEGGHASQRWLTYREAQLVGGNVRRDEKGITVCYAETSGGSSGPLWSISASTFAMPRSS